MLIAKVLYTLSIVLLVTSMVLRRKEKMSDAHGVAVMAYLSLLLSVVIPHVFK